MTPLAALILHKLQREHVGMALAIQRRDLLAWLWGNGVATTDRKVRYAVKELGCVGSCAAGYYLPADERDAVAYIRYTDKKIFPLFEDKQRFKSAYPQYFSGGQMELFNADQA